MLEIRNVTKILNKKKVLDGISYTFDEKTIYGLHGINGSGKTMLLRLIAGLIVPTQGEVYWKTMEIGRASCRERV